MRTHSLQNTKAIEKNIHVETSDRVEQLGKVH